MKTIKRKLDVEKVLKDLVEKHNRLAINSEGQIEQLIGTIDAFQKMMEMSGNELRQLSNNTKQLVFHLNRLQAENVAMRMYLEEKGTFKVDEFKQIADKVFINDLGVDSDYVPVGRCTVTYYN